MATKADELTEEALVAYQKKEKAFIKKTIQLPLGTWKPSIDKFCEEHEKKYPNIYYKCNAGYKKANGIKILDPSKSRKNHGGKGDTYTRKNHQSALKRGTPLEISQTELRFPITSISIEKRGDDFEFVVKL